MTFVIIKVISAKQNVTAIFPVTLTPRGVSPKRFKNQIKKGKSLDNLRLASSNQTIVPGKVVQNGGWHFSYLGGSKAIKQKLDAHPL